MEFYSAVKKNEIMKLLGKWVELEKSYTKWSNPGSES